MFGRLNAAKVTLVMSNPGVLGALIPPVLALNVLADVCDTIKFKVSCMGVRRAHGLQECM